MRHIVHMTLPIVILAAAALACGPTDSSVEQGAGPAVTATMQALATLVAQTTGDEQADQPEQPPQPDEPPTPTPTVTPTPEPLPPMLSVTLNTNCREGPGDKYPYKGALLVGETAEVFGIDSSRRFYYIQNPDEPSAFCWVWGQYAQVSGDISQVAVITPPPPPVGSIAGYVYIDGNHNGVRDPSEHSDYLTGYRIFLLEGPCPGGTTLAMRESAHPGGRFVFDDLLAGDYCVTRDLAGQTVFPDWQDVSLPPGEAVDDVNFRYVP